MKYPPVGACIYCGITKEQLANGALLTTEHIIAEGLGGEDELPEASCGKCRDITSYVERVCLRGCFAQARAYLGAYGSRRSDTRPKTFDVVRKTASEEEVVQVPLEDNPFWITMLRMRAPGILEGRTMEDDRQSAPCVPEMISEPGRDQKLRNIGMIRKGPVTVEQTVEIKPGEFWKLLAKIAHAYAVATFGHGSFTAFLTDFIIGRDEHGSQHYIGGAYSACGAPIQSLGSVSGLHDVRIYEISNNNGERLIVVRLHLFAQIEAPVYDVVAGRVN